MGIIPSSLEYLKTDSSGKEWGENVAIRRSKNSRATPQSLEVPLSGRLQEFRTALREEIEASKRTAASSAVPLINGRRIAQIGARFQYTFEIENVLNLPGDAPGDLHIDNRAPLEVDIVAVDGLTVVLSIPENLGTVVPFARLQSNLTFLMRKLIARIEAMSGKTNVVGDRILHPFPVEGFPAQICVPHLNLGQTRAVSSSVGRNITFIWGPPGTGKTHTIGTLAEQLFALKRSVLLVSHTNTAVDQALLHISNALSSSDVTSALLDAGHVLRVGDPRDQRLAEQQHLLLGTHVARRSAALAEQRQECEGKLDAAATEVIRVSHLINLCEWVQEARADIEVMSEDFNEIRSLERQAQVLADQHRQLSASSAHWATASASANQANEWLVRMGVLQNNIGTAESRLDENLSAIQSLTAKLYEAESVLREIASVNWIVRSWRGLPTREDQQKRVANLQGELKSLRAATGPVEIYLRTLQEEHTAYVHRVASFEQEYHGAPSDILAQAQDRESRLRELYAAAQHSLHRGNSRRATLESTLRARLVPIKEMGYAPSSSDTAEGMLQAVRSAYQGVCDEVRHLDIHRLRADQETLNVGITWLQGEIAGIDESLKKVEQIVISEATIVATTLTRAYLRDTIQSRRFDTVILDEASMAPIPALWIAASLADANAVLVGDFKQLPPIVQSTQDLAKKWLGRDVFEVADLTHSDGCPPFSEVLCPLFEQHRMHPAISAVPNHFIYHNQLQDRGGNYDENEFGGWHNSECGLDSPVLLVDTESLNAWVTNAGRSGNSSRLNFLSATVCVDLAGQLLRSDRPQHSPGSRARILVVCPYRPHARLVEVILRSEGLSGEVIAGTAHSFQGNEADIVIFDLVNDEPHWKVRLFAPDYDEDTKRLLNVAVTRARRQLIVVGDFAYHLKQAKRAFLGRDLVPYLMEHYPRVEAKSLIPAGVAARAAAVQTSLQGGSVEPTTARLVVTQKDFFRLLTHDIQNADNRVVFYSAFLASHRIGEIQTVIRAAAERGVKVYVVTKPISDRKKSEAAIYSSLEQTLVEWGVCVVHKAKMHEKIVFVDDSVIWVGSLNALSFRDTQEVMERRCSREVFADYEKTLRLEELLKEYEGGQPTCPWCGAEVVASEARLDGPFYWRCVRDGCYTRRIDEEALASDIVLCKRCHGDVEYARRGEKAVWRCKSNHQHFQHIKRMHLRLPKMRAIVPPSVIRQLDEELHVTNESILTDLGSQGKREPKKNTPIQRRLFDDDAEP